MSNYHRASILSLCLLLLALGAVAQNPEKLYKRGIDAFYSEDFKAAVTYFEQIESSGKSFKDSEYRLEISLLVQKENRERSLDKILKFRTTKARSDKFYNYWMGRIYANRYMFPEAVNAWKAFLKSKAFKSEQIREETRNFIQEAELLVSYFDNPDNFEIHQLEAPVNTEFAELTPVYSAEKNELLFASNRDNAKNDIFLIYHTLLSTNKDWKNPTPIQALGEFDRSTANVEVVNEDGRLFVFKDKKGGDLYTSQPEADGWSTPQEFDSKITSTHLESHFFINEHEDRILFAAKNKKNGLDIMESYRNAETGKWEKPHLLSATINSVDDEDSPFLSQDETKLYFSSNRPGGLGGMDIYVCTFDKATNQWSEPENMGWPINSPDDDIHFKMNPDMNSGYFSSNRIHTKGDYDIFFFWAIEKTSIEGRVINAKTEEPITSGEIRFHPSQYLEEYFRSPLSESGQYSTEIISDEVFRVEVIQKYDTLLTETFEIHDAKGEQVTHFKDFYVYPSDLTAAERAALQAKYASKEEPTAADSSAQEEAPTLLSQKEGNELTATDTSTTKPTNSIARPNTTRSVPSKSYARGTRIVRNVYFEFGTSTLTADSYPQLERLLNYLRENPEIKIEIGGHTDNVGNTANNLKISLERAESVKKWLTTKGISENRLQAKGYGESQPLASNDDEKNGRELNRRIEIRVIQ
ncbi:OmpA family protein [Marinoscillum furvescens]|uniref:Outer membrane protein OmpA-like peptidoglycan-associated protein n=1 Tax=Marinoscillum furvescens DSM 4134 TaxID=1122208 RepID=A0A3D9LFZ9_MARFU|nr:OmpA family protein [Marinoscillum furvescens]REE05558.1 outer membrane protein OmpA-like peptidoglycan-associated protein [Marinoscillum furvescens DSM 4134]